METPDPPNDTPGALKQVVLTPRDILWSLRVQQKKCMWTGTTENPKEDAGGPWWNAWDHGEAERGKKWHHESWELLQIMHIRLISLDLSISKIWCTLSFDDSAQENGGLVLDDNGAFLSLLLG